MTATPRIFVSIASYRDRDCQWTIKDLFEKAADPSRVYIGLCWQVIAEEDRDCFEVETRPQQCRVIVKNARESLGVCWARHLVQTLWQGEEYILQIDAHMRFVQDWDAKLLAMLASCPADRPVLSSYPSAFTPPDRVDSHVVSAMYAQTFDPNGILKLNSIGHPPVDPPPPPAANPFIAAGFLFADSRVVGDIPYDPHLYFDGEEITLAVRLWTHGWDIFAPNQVIAYHDYNNHPGRRRHWQDQSRWTELNELSLKRVRHLLAMDSCDDPRALVEIDRYGLGRQRSLADWQAMSGIDFARRLIHGRTAEEIAAATPEADKRRNNAHAFGLIWNGNLWGDGESRSGSGSTRASTVNLAPALKNAFSFLGIRSLVDVGCGDMTWMAGISETLDFYFGVDIVDDMLAHLRGAYGHRRGHFFSNLDITLDPLPPADAILCRDVLTHLPDFAVKAALGRIKSSGARYLMATTHPDGANQSIQLGAWHAMNLCQPPFNLPEPPLMISEGLLNSQKSLGVWRIETLPE